MLQNIQLSLTNDEKLCRHKIVHQPSQQYHNELTKEISIVGGTLHIIWMGKEVKRMNINEDL